MQHRPRHRAWVACALGMGLVACARAPSAKPPTPASNAAAPAAAPSSSAAAPTAAPMPADATAATALGPLAFGAPLPACATQVTAAARRALDFAATLDVDPERLRSERGMHGHKHVTELLALLRLVDRWPGDPALSARARAMAHAYLDKVATRPEFHDMARLDAAEYQAASMSWLRACAYAEELGWDTAAWRKAIHADQARLDAHLASRGIEQRMAFALLYGTLGLPGAERLVDLYPHTAIAEQRDFGWFVEKPERGYDFTHEVFALTARGTARPPWRSDAEQRYAERAAYLLLHVHMTEKGHDLTAELMLSRRWLGAPIDDQLAYARGWMLASQNPDGTFGFHTESLIRQQKGNPRYDVRVGGYLHTTMIALWALMETCH